ncbi:hypothetical protein BGX38DRAFT_1150464 [Terfezia claveryi]|nr:hypothetical protein BGX38DRAFT_1150464 [Terfezia claveryi]
MLSAGSQSTEPHLTILEKRQICKKRQDPKHAKEKLREFGKHFLDSEGRAVAISNVVTHLM